MARSGTIGTDVHEVHLPDGREPGDSEGDPRRKAAETESNRQRGDRQDFAHLVGALERHEAGQEEDERDTDVDHGLAARQPG